MVDPWRFIRAPATCCSSFLALIACILASGCEPRQSSLSDPGMPSFLDYCVGTSQQCGEVDDVITDLENSTDPDCQALGQSARSRFASASYGFTVDDSYPAYWGWVLPVFPCIDECDPLATYTSGITYLSPGTFGAGEVGRTVAHEEMHHDYDASDAAAEAQALDCFPY